ncbi:MAG: DUF1217 domain-containing protein [Henriciella sp.]|uniref:DUF1217 domain-containing protein n=1 Tax=Henriciella sp. TaxID=1968823 RepID=UPI003C75F0BE
MYQPAIPLSGYGGWKLLQSTYTRQLEGFTDSSSVKNDRAYLTEKLSSPISLDDFMSDRRLLRVSLTAFDLGGEEWKGGFIRKVLEEASDPESTFLQRLNNSDYTLYSKTFAFQDGQLSLSAEQVEEIAGNFEAAAFRGAVGEVDNSMRLSLNYQSKIVEIAGTGSSEETSLYKILGNTPVRNVIGTALNLPADMSKLDIDRQADILKEKLESVMGISDVADLTSIDKVDKMLQRYHVMNTINDGPSPTTPGYAALTLLGGGGSTSGFGALASQNLFLSRF